MLTSGFLWLLVIDQHDRGAHAGSVLVERRSVRRQDQCRAVLVGTGISIDVLKVRRRAGDSVKRLTRDDVIGESKVAAVVAWDERQAA